MGSRFDPMNLILLPVLPGAAAPIAGACRARSLVLRWSDALLRFARVAAGNVQSSCPALVVGLTLAVSAAGVSAAPLGNYFLLTDQTPEDINDNGMVVGRDGAFGFVMRNGIVTPYVAAPVRGLVSAFSQLYGVNNAGEMVGEYFAVGVAPTGFLDRNGTLITIRHPDPLADRTIPQDINNRGHIAGFFNTTTGRNIGFILRGSQFEKIEIAGVRFVTILGMNDADQLVGHITMEGDQDFIRHGILWSQGQVTPITIPGAINTEPRGIGEDGTIVGTYSKLVGGIEKRFAFVLRKGVVTTIGVPGVLNNEASGINRRGMIAGGYFSLEVDFFSGEIFDVTSAGWVFTP